MDFFFLIEIHGIGRTEFHTGLAFTFFKIDTVVCVNDIFEGYGLGILYIDCLAFGKTLVIFIVYLAGAFCGAYAAGDAFIHIHVAGAFTNGYRKMPCLAFNRYNIRQCDQVNVQMPADLDQFG